MDAGAQGAEEPASVRSPAATLVGVKGDFDGAGATLGPAGRAGAGRLVCWAEGGGGGRAGTGRLVTPPGERGGASPAVPPPKTETVR